jgi:hypothetical protein
MPLWRCPCRSIISLVIDWALIMMFYAAMHYVEAYLANFGVHLKSHTARDSYIGKETKLRQIFVDYQDLKFYGYNARYEMVKFVASDFTNAAQSLAKIKAYLTPLL